MDKFHLLFLYKTTFPLYIKLLCLNFTTHKYVQIFTFLLFELGNPVKTLGYKNNKFHLLFLYNTTFFIIVVPKFTTHKYVQIFTFFEPGNIAQERI